jgi:hypothetical protein
VNMQLLPVSILKSIYRLPQGRAQWDAKSQVTRVDQLLNNRITGNTMNGYYTLSPPQLHLLAYEDGLRDTKYLRRKPKPVFSRSHSGERPGCWKKW